MSDSRSRSKRGEKVLTKYALDSTYYSESLKSGVFGIDEEGNLRVVPVFIIDPTRNPTPVSVPQVANIFKSTQFTTGAAAANVWVPAANMRFRLMGYSIDISSDVAEAALDNLITVVDGAAAIFRHACTIPAVAVLTGNGGKSIYVDLGRGGYLSAAKGNILTVAVAANLTAGRITMNAWGTEEP
jgi:hypothetical protein